jgi:hypothetical protein
MVRNVESLENTALNSIKSYQSAFVLLKNAFFEVLQLEEEGCKEIIFQ